MEEIGLPGGTKQRELHPEIFKMQVPKHVIDQTDFLKHMDMNNNKMKKTITDLLVIYNPVPM